MKIPVSFQLLGKTYKVEDQPLLHYTDGASGMAYHRSKRIGILPNTPGFPRSPEDIEQTYLHELIHHILHAMGENKLNDSEKFVQMFSGFLHQAIVTAEYEDKRSVKSPAKRGSITQTVARKAVQAVMNRGSKSEKISQGNSLAQVL